jgi:hypothetical protein
MENQIDGEAEIDKLLMMHMSKNSLEAEVDNRLENSSSQHRMHNEHTLSNSDHTLKSSPKEEAEGFS